MHSPKPQFDSNPSVCATAAEWVVRVGEGEGGNCESYLGINQATVACARYHRVLRALEPAHGCNSHNIGGEQEQETRYTVPK